MNAELSDTRVLCKTLVDYCDYNTFNLPKYQLEPIFYQLLSLKHAIQYVVKLTKNIQQLIILNITVFIILIIVLS